MSERAVSPKHGVCVCPPAGGGRRWRRAPVQTLTLFSQVRRQFPWKQPGAETGTRIQKREASSSPLAFLDSCSQQPWDVGFGTWGVARGVGGGGSGFRVPPWGAMWGRVPATRSGDVQHWVQAGWDDSCAHLHVGASHAAAPTCAPCGCRARRCCIAVLCCWHTGGPRDRRRRASPGAAGRALWGAAGTASTVLWGGGLGAASPSHRAAPRAWGAQSCPGLMAPRGHRCVPGGRPKGWLSSALLPAGWDGDTARLHPPRPARQHCVCTP